MNRLLKHITPRMILTLALLVFFEVINSTMMSVISSFWKPPFFLLLVLYLNFKRDNPLIPLQIFLIHYVHALFSVEGWSIGLMSSLIISVLVSYLRELMNFTSIASTMILTQVFQLAWFAIFSLLIFIKTDSWSFMFLSLQLFLLESFILSLLSPIAFSFFDKIWTQASSGLNGHLAGEEV